MEGGEVMRESGSEGEDTDDDGPEPAEDGMSTDSEDSTGNEMQRRRSSVRSSAET